MDEQRLAAMREHAYGLLRLALELPYKFDVERDRLVLIEGEPLKTLSVCDAQQLVAGRFHEPSCAIIRTTISRWLSEPAVPGEVSALVVLSTGDLLMTQIGIRHVPTAAGGDA